MYGINRVGGPMARIIFVRHNETVWNAENRIQGQLDLELSEFGEKQAEILSDALKNFDFDTIYSSPLQRAIKTSEIICKKRTSMQIAPELAEIFLGPWQGLTVKEVKDGFVEEYKSFRESPDLYESNEMETLQDVGERFSEFIKKIMYHENKLYCVVSHGTAMRAGLAKLIFGDVKYMNNLVFENGSITEVDFHCYKGDITPVIYKLNDTGHFLKTNGDRSSTKILMGVI